MPSIVIEAPEPALDAFAERFDPVHRIEGFVLLDAPFGDVVDFMVENDVETTGFHADLTVDARSD